MDGKHDAWTGRFAMSDYSMTWAEKPTKKNSVGADCDSGRLSSTDRPSATAVEKDRYR